MPKTKEYTEDEELLYLISENNEDANEEICKKYDSVITYYVNKYSNLVEGKGLDKNDLYQEGLIGLLRAIDNYKTQKDIKFSTFAFICIKRRIISAVREASRKKYSILNESYSLDYKLEETSGGLDNILYDSNKGVEDLLVSKENIKAFNSKLNESLTDLEKTVYDLRINNFSYEEIAASLGKTTKSIDGTLGRIRLKIKNILEEIN